MMRLRTFSQILFTLLASAWLLSQFTGCRPAENTSSTPSEDESFTESGGDAEELMAAYPRYAEAKEAMMDGDFASAEANLTSLLQETDPHPAFANDLGIVHMRKGDSGAALEAFDTAIGLDPQYERAWYNKGLLQSRTGNIEAAEKAYRKAVEINPYYFEAHYNLGLLLYQQKRYLEAETSFLTIAGNTRASRFNRVYYQLGLICAANGEDASAIKYYDESLLLDPSHVPSYLNKAAALIRVGLPAKARETLERARKLAPDDSRIFWNLGLAWLDEQDDDKAREAFKETLALNPTYAPALINLAAIAIREGNYAEAKVFLADAARIEPENPNIPWNLGLIAADEGDDILAAQYFQQSLEREPDNAAAHLNLAAAYIRMDQLDRALEHTDRAARLDPGDYRIFWNRGLIARQRGDEEAARGDFEKVIQLQPDYAPALFNLGLAAYRSGNWELARERFHMAAYSDSAEPYPEAHYMLAKTFSEEGRYNAAINEYEIALKLNPDYREAAYNLALNLDASGDSEAAVALYRRLAEEADPPPEALNNLATWHLANNRPGEAIPLLEKALESDPAYVTAAYNLGLAHLRQDAFSDAAAALQKTVELDSGYFAAWKNLGIAHARMEAYEPALKAMQQAFILDPSDADTAVYVVKYLKLLDRPEDEITEVYRRSHATGARNPLMLRHLGRTAFDNEEYGAAAGYYEEYIELRPSPVYIYNLGLARLRNGEFEKAIAAFSEATQLDPDNFAYWKNLGIAQSRLENYPKALEAMQRAFSIDPTDAETAVYLVKYLKLLDRPESDVTEVYRTSHTAGARDTLQLRHLARAAFSEEDYDAAAAYYSEYVALRPSPVYYYNLGLALRKAERFEEAGQAYEEAVRRDPDYAKAWVNLGYVRAFMGQRRAAEKAFRKALEIDPAYENAAAALNDLKNGNISP